MSLTAKRFEEIVATLNPVPPRNSKDEKRQSSRVTVNTLVQIHPHRNGRRDPAMAVKIRDFSPRGVSIEFPRQIDRGEQFVLHVPRKTTMTALLCSVVYCRPLKGGNFSVGAEFIGTLDEPATRSAPQPDKSEIDRIKASMFG